MTLATRVAVMKRGRLQQFDTPLNIYNHPANRFIAEFVGSPSMNFVDGKIENETFFSESIKIRVTRPNTHQITMGIRPEHIRVFTEPQAGAIAATVYVTELMGNETFVFLSVGNNKLIARAAADFRAELESPVWLRIVAEKAHFFDSRTGLSV
jgi:multiple sugar transport system ATP-binding protein